MTTENTCDKFNYEIWAPAMKTTLIEQGLWDVVKNGVPPDLPESSATIELSRWRDLDSKALQILYTSLPDSAFKETLPASSSAKEIWDLLQNANEGGKAIMRILEKQCEQLSKGENESSDSYFDRINDIVGQLSIWNIEISTFEILRKLYSSPPPPGPPGGLPALFEKLEQVYNMDLLGFLKYMYTIGAEKELITEELVLLVMRILELKAAFYESMWLLLELDTMHMTPYEKFFTTLDRTHKGKVELEDESFAMVEGIGDVKITMKEGKTETINNVLFVPHGIKRNVLSLSQMESRGYSISEGEEGECIIRDRTGAEFGKSTRSKGDLLLDLRVIEGNLTS